MSNEQKKSIVDLLILMGLPYIVICILYPFGETLIQGYHSLFISYCVVECSQFFSFGLGTIWVILVRKENLANYGIVKKNSLKSILLSFLIYIPLIVLILLKKLTWMFIPYTLFNYYYTAEGPFISTAIDFITINILIFMHVFTYIVINDKINKIFRPKNLFLNPGAILTAIFVVLIHVLVGGIQFRWLDAVTNFILIYGTLVIREHTENSIGSIFWWFTLCYNNFG